MKLKILFLSIFLFTSLIYAQAELDTTKQNVFKKHSLQFRVTNVLSLSSFKGTLISYKFHFNDKRAIRFGISLVSRSIAEDKLSEKDYEELENTEQNLIYGDLSLYFSGEYLYYFNPSDEIKFFAGIGPQVNIFIDDKSTKDFTNSDTSANYSYYKDYTRHTYQLGLTSAYGLEWFFRKNMSLHAEYSFSFLYYYKRFYKNYVQVLSGENDNSNKYETLEKGLIFNSNYVRFGMSVYF